MYINNGIYTFRVINYSFDKPIHIISERVLKSMLLPYNNKLVHSTNQFTQMMLDKKPMSL